MKTISLIREKLWNQAMWLGTAFAESPDDTFPPLLALVFTKEEMAKEIFENWRKELGEVDKNELLRITIIRGIDIQNPFAYRITIGSNPNLGYEKNRINFAVMISRMHTMEPKSNANLERFLKNYHKFNGYYFTPAIADEKLKDVQFFYELCIAKRELFVREAWEVGLNDTESTGIFADDDPVIPKGISDAPVIELLKLKKGK